LLSSFSRFVYPAKTPPRFTLTHLTDITSIGGNGGGQQQEAPNPPVGPPENPGIFGFT